MPESFSLPQASTMAGSVDLLIFALTTMSLTIALGISLAIVYFGVRYRKDSVADRTAPPPAHLGLEILWTGVPLVVGMGFFVWGASLYYQNANAPSDALPVYVIGKQWMWKMYHPDGQREINDLHVPVGRPVKLVMTSQDVVHDLAVPAFRVKHDVVPGRYTTVWFTPTRVGQYRLYCNQYCGAKHSEMTGTVYVMDASAYQQWLAGRPVGLSLAGAGEQTFGKLGCAACHTDEGSGRGPSLAGVAGSTVKLTTGATVTADDDYLRESIVNPKAKLVAGFQPVMPAYDTMLDEQAVLELVAYIKSKTRPGGTK